MKLALLGLLIIGVGSYLATIDRWKVAGFSVVALGGVVTYLAQRRDSARFEKKLEVKLAEVHQEIASAKTLLPAESAKRLDQIDNAFRTWAAGFVKNKEQRKLEVEQRRVADLKQELDNSRLWRPVLELAFRTVAGAWKAYAEQTGLLIRVRVPELPENLYDKSARYAGEVMFPRQGHWIMVLGTGLLSMSADMPTLDIMWLRPGKERDHIGEIWCANRAANFVSLSLYSDVLPRLSGIEGSFTQANYQTELPKAIMRLVEAQIFALDADADRR
jgi:hypothetical protein